MRQAIVVAVVFVTALVSGCGGDKDDQEQWRAEQKREIEQVRDQLRTLSAQVRQLRGELRELDSDVFELKGELGVGLMGRSDTDTAGDTDGQAPSDGGPDEAIVVEPVKAESLEELAEELANVRADMARLRQELVREKELAELQDPRKTWAAMNDPKKLSWRLDRFSERHARSIEDEATREEFLAEVTRLKEDLGARAALTKEELLDRYRNKLGDRVNTETNARMRQWYEQQLQTLNTGTAKVVESQLATFQRYDSIQGLKELASKYTISNQVLRENGLQTYGGAYNWK